MRRSTSVSTGSVVQSRYVILEAYVIPFPCREPDLGVFHRLSRVVDVPRSLTACLLVAVSWRVRLLFPGLFSGGCLPDCGSASPSARLRFRCFGRTVSGVAMQTSAIVVSMGLQMAQLSLLPWLGLLLHLSLASSPFCAGWPISVFPQNRPGRSFLKGRLRCLSWPLDLVVICLKSVYASRVV